MEDAAGVRGGEPVTDLQHQIELLFERHAVGSGEVVAERAAVEALHDEVDAPLLLAHVVQLDDVGVEQSAGGLGLAQEAGSRLGLVGQVGHHDLDGHFPPGLLVARGVDDPHRALAEPGDHAVAPYSFGKP